MNGNIPSLEHFNRTEMTEIIRRQTARTVRRSIPIERMRELVESGQAPRDDELAGTMRSRYYLERFVASVWVQISSQIPCEGQNRGRCTVFGCNEARHIDCVLRSPKTALL